MSSLEDALGRLLDMPHPATVSETLVLVEKLLRAVAVVEGRMSALAEAVTVLEERIAREERKP